MKLTTITVRTREENGKGPAGRARYAGDIPGVVYGQKKGSAGIMIDKKSFDHLINSEQGQHALVDLKVSNDDTLNGPAIIKEVQQHPVSGAVLHFDLMRVDLSKKIQTQIPITLAGHSVGIVAGGVLDHQLRELEIECLPLDVPLEIIGDITNLDIGETYHVSDLPKDDKLTFLTEDGRAVAAIHQPRVAVEENAADLAEAEEEAAAAEEAEADDE